MCDQCCARKHAKIKGHNHNGYVVVSKKFFPEHPDISRLVAFVVDESEAEGILKGDIFVVDPEDKGIDGDFVALEIGGRSYVRKRQLEIDSGMACFYPIAERSTAPVIYAYADNIVGKVIKYFPGEGH